MRKLAIVTLIVLTLAGCTGDNVEPIPGPTRAPTPFFSYGPRPSSTPIPNEATAPITWIDPPVSTFPLVCTGPTQYVMDWLRDTNHNPGLAWVSVVMVHIGAGLLPDSDWWMVYVGGAQLEKQYWTFWLWDKSTNQWIGQGLDYVDWSGERLARGEAARDKARSCLR